MKLLMRRVLKSRSHCVKLHILSRKMGKTLKDKSNLAEFKNMLGKNEKYAELKNNDYVPHPV